MSSKKYTRWTKEQLEPIVSSSDTYAECLRKMGLVTAGGNFSNLQRNIDKFQLDTSHMVHQAHNAGKEFKKFDDLLKPSSIKARLIKERKHKCEHCGLSKWLSQKIGLELHHIDGNNRNNVRENLQLLCPNCHYTTDNFRNRKR